MHIGTEATTNIAVINKRLIFVNIVLLLKKVMKPKCLRLLWPWGPGKTPQCFKKALKKFDL
ncbi:hypothetical protein EBO34_18610 [Alteribacter keqinensis]|uniref:Uncharacterized protein n=2 Tax=Alteribacter keqinensis TaxID=2483800 RepID=A0A3M7TPC4_9BACI|nr:hypothetical protein EBO34_18610 [Alteribacter keqinensis]